MTGNIRRMSSKSSAIPGSNLLLGVAYLLLWLLLLIDGMAAVDWGLLRLPQGGNHQHLTVSNSEPASLVRRAEAGASLEFLR